MTRRMMAAAGLIVSAACGGSGADPVAPSTEAARQEAPRGLSGEDRTRITAVLDAQRAAWNRGDLDGYMEGYARTPDLVFTAGGEIQRGWDGTLARYRARYGTDRSGMGQLTFEILEVQPVGSDGAVVLGRWKLEGTPKAAGGVFSVVLERQPDGWRIIHDHTTKAP